MAEGENFCVARVACGQYPSESAENEAHQWGKEVHERGTLPTRQPPETRGITRRMNIRHPQACDLPKGWQPDDTAPERSLTPVAYDNEIELAEILAGTPGIDESDTGWVFDDPSHRCLAWIALQDRLEEAGISVTSGEQPATLIEDSNTSAQRQAGLLVADGAGGSLIVTTEGSSSIVLSPAAWGTGTQFGGASFLAVCQLDRTVEVRVAS